MKTELQYLLYVTIFTGLLWVPYILDRIAVGGINDAVGYPEVVRHSAWGLRLKKAHYNAIENLVIFAVLILVADDLGVKNNAIGNAAILYFWARVVHVIAYTAAWPWVRTLAFAAGFFAQAAVAWNILVR
ncbi:MAG TPA: MAPEG family protein [Burkholderiales bacterium]|nr:MAPEG family protein [Burkholderiales bacterium]